MRGRRIGDIRALDEDFMAWARPHGHVVLTHGLDFRALLYVTDARAPRAIQIRAEHSVPRVLGALALERPASVADRLEAGAPVTVAPRRQRIRRLP